MALSKQDICIDAGKMFGKVKSPDFYKLYYQYNALFLDLLVKNIEQEHSSIADYGGGNGILAKQILKEIKLKKKECTIDIIDLDKNKETAEGKINFIHKDVFHYHRKNYYDFSLCRFMAHYFDRKELEMFMARVYDNLKPDAFFLLINWVQDTTESYKQKRAILDIIQQEKNIACRTIPTTVLLTETARKVGFTIARMKKVSYSISINDFYKQRFKLSSEAVTRIVQKTGIARHQEQQVGILLMKA